MRRFDWLMFASMFALAFIGIVFIYSAGSVRPVASLQNLYKVHAVTAVFGLMVYFVMSYIDYRKLLDWCALPYYIVALLMLVAVLIFGAEIYGGKRWLWFFQPSEISKLAIILFVAQLFGMNTDGLSDKLRKWFTGGRGLLMGLGVLGVPALLILAEPDLGTALVLVPAVIAMLLAARVWTKGLVTLLLVGILSAGALLGTVYVAEREAVPEKREQIYKYVPLRPHQIKRLRVFLFPDTDIYGAGYNLRQAQISIGSGSITGKGIGKGSQKFLGYLPPSVSMNDFIFAVLAEEAGFVGSLLVLILFLGILLPGLRIALCCKDDRGRLLVIGVMTLIFCHVYINIAMSIGLMPITGLPLPFISAGRTFLVVLMAALGIVQSVSIYGRSEGD